MSVRYLSKHIVTSEDTVESLVRNYRLSSWRAVIDIDSNRSITGMLPDSGSLPEGLTINIPPQADALLKERLYVLHRIRPGFLRHFDSQLESAERDLRSLLLSVGELGDISGVESVMATMDKEVNQAVDDLAGQSWPLVSLSVGMSHTHVAERTDRMAAGTVGDPLCGLYWAISPPVLGLWRGLWFLDSWIFRWQGRTPEDAWTVVRQHHNTVRSLVVQQVDLRIKEAQRIQQTLQRERGR